MELQSAPRCRRIRRRKISLALSTTILFNNGGLSLLFVEAVEPPVPTSTRKNNIPRPNLGSSNNDINNPDNDNNKEVEQADFYQTEETVSDYEEDKTHKHASIIQQHETIDKIDSITLDYDTKHRNINRRKRAVPRQSQQQQHQTKDEDNNKNQGSYDAYMHWCEKVLGIQSLVEIQEFEYIDHLELYWDENNKEQDYNEGRFDWLEEYTSSKETAIDLSDEAVERLPTKLVRGLAAKQDIQVDDIVISIPLFSLLSIPTTIDHDPVLSQILGTDSRKKYGWTNTAEYELPLLVLAVLYHRSLGVDSPISHYIDILLVTNIDSFPFLWSDEELSEKTDGEAKKLAKGIRQDLHQMYNEVMGTLVRENPKWFAPPDGYNPNIDDSDIDEWTYSYDNFQWAFALVISRHHFLPIAAFDDKVDTTISDVVVVATESSVKMPTPKLDDYPSVMHETLSSVNEVVPPANQPTDSWVDEAHNEERVVEDDIVASFDDDLTSSLQLQMSLSDSVKHSFLAPLADLINFGPPCLIGSYNEEKHTFELIAACPFAKGQEVTFWYSSDCSDVIIANYGFLHPLVPPCAAVSDDIDWEKKSNALRKKVDTLYEDLAILESRLIGCQNSDSKKDDNGKMKDVIYAMPTTSTTKDTIDTKMHQQKLRKDGGQQHNSLRPIRGRVVNELAQQDINSDMMEELG